MNNSEANDVAGEALPEFLQEFARPPSLSLSPSLLGTVTGRMPGQQGETAGLSIARVRVSAKLEAGVAYTEVEEELFNDTGGALEAVAAFRAPPRGVITRMALWVDDRLVDAEVVERDLASDVYTSIVERSRDPALLERDPSGSLKLRIFPVPAHGTRRVVVGYAQPLEWQAERYSFELGLRLDEQAPPLAALSAEVQLVGVDLTQLAGLPDEPTTSVTASREGTRLRWTVANVQPHDWRLSFAAPEQPLTIFAPPSAKGAERFVSLRVTPDLPATPARHDATVWLLDTSAGQSGAALALSQALVARLIARLPLNQPFAVLACDTRCVSFPRHGLTRATDDTRRQARHFVAGLEAGGASDIGYALFEAWRRTRAQLRAEVVYFGDARPTAGDLDADAMLERLAARSELFDLRLVGIGDSLDAGALDELAGRLGAARTVVRGQTQGAALADIERWLAEPILREPRLALPGAFEAVYPRQLPNLVRGDEQLILARLERGAARVLVGQLSAVLDDGAEAWQQLAFELPRNELRADGVPRLWAHARLKDLDDRDTNAAYDESVALSKQYQVLGRHTSFLALESNSMFEQLGIGQRFGRADFGREPLQLAPRRLLPQGSHQVHAPKVRMAGTLVSGRLPPEAIRRVVRNNDGKFRACYHSGLLKNPQLAGTVSTRFVIGRDGTVVTAEDGGSTLVDRAVVDCVARMFATLSFPAPEAPVTVIYPFNFSPSTTEEPRPLPAPWPFRPRLAAWPEAPPEAPMGPSAVERPSASKLAARVELEPNDAELQAATAQAYEAEGSERRACAHFRAAATLAPRDLELQYQALRCRARVLGERLSVLADVNRLELHSPSIDALATRLRTLADIPAY